MPLPNQSSLLSQLIKGQEKAYKELFDTYYPLLVSLANKMTHDVELARDCAQGTLVKIYEKRNTLSGIVSLEAYLKRAVINESINVVKKASGIVSLGESTAEETANEYRHLIEEAEEEANIWKEIEALPGQCRHIFKLNRFEGFSNQEIAEQLGISKRTVETQISIALKKLKAKLLAFFELIF